MKASSEINWVEVPWWVEDKRFIRFEIYDPKHSSLWKAVPTNKVMEAYEPREWRGLPKLRVVYEENLQESVLPIYGISTKQQSERFNENIVKKATPDFIVELHEGIDELTERKCKHLVILITLLAMFAVIFIVGLYYFTHRGI